MSPELPLVFFTIPYYNSVQFIDPCIEGVLSQDYPHVEHIVQDGASSDGTVDIMARCGGHVDWVSERKVMCLI